MNPRILLLASAALLVATQFAQAQNAAISTTRSNIKKPSLQAQQTGNRAIPGGSGPAKISDQAAAGNLTSFTRKRVEPKTTTGQRAKAPIVTTRSNIKRPSQ